MRKLIVGAVFTTFIYTSSWMPPDKWAFAPLVSYAIPIVLTFNILLIIFHFTFQPKSLFFSIASLLFGFNHLIESAALNIKNNGSSNNFSVLSYNVKFFREHKNYGAFSSEIINWTVQDSSKIKCIQEFSTNARWDDLNITQQMYENGYWSHTYNSKMKGEHNPGLATFTKYPIVHRGIAWDYPNHPNGCIFTDVLINKDTIRIYNIHLASMRLELYKLKSWRNWIDNFNNVIKKLTKGSQIRQQQINLTIDHCQSSPYPFILVGDFNETPYSSNYRLLDNLFHSSFHQAGNGFDFTLNNPLFFLRIDHQFSGPGMEATYYEVDRKARVSDHFPTRARYRLVKEND